jgi:SAM-dependent methyltransferase
MTNLVRARNGESENAVGVVRYRNARGDTVAGILDATFDTSDNTIRPDLAIVLAPAILKRKEVFGLFARTILDNLERENLSGVVLRFDASHIVGESTMDARLVAEGRPYYNWTFGHLKDDMAASFRYLEQRFRPAHNALISVSLSAIPARKLMVEGDHPPADIWIAPFGCPDAQDMVRNYLAGLDLFPAYEEGNAPESVMIHGRPIRSTALYGQSLEDGMAYLEDAQRDLSNLEIPVCWVLGKHDHWVTHSRVKSMLEAPGSGTREIFEIPTGHVLKGGSEAIELFKLVSETLLKHLFKIDRSAADPDMNRFVAQSQSEWSRVKRAKLGDSTEFWREHLFGENGHDEGYDIMLDHPGYPRFLRRQVELLDPKAGEDVADLGCGTGNLSVEILRACRGATPNSLTYVDLVPGATERTAQKVIDICAGDLGSEPAHRGVVMDLEVPRLAAVNDFLQGKLWSLEELVGRVEGLESGSAKRIQKSYNKDLHAVLRGRRVSAKWLKRVAPALNENDVETVLDISLAARFLKGLTDAEDCIDGVDEATTAEDLALRRLSFGSSGRSLSFEFPTGSFDKIGASLLVPYLFDPLAFLSEVHRILRPGGVLVASSIVPNFDPSKTYQEAAEIIRESAGAVAERKLAALRHYGNMVSRLIEFEEDGRFHFHGGGALCALAEEAGFSEARSFPAFGSPPTTVIIRARK